jgi:phosphoglycerol transferase MdoB-like AlkP superfamily enzyme
MAGSALFGALFVLVLVLVLIGIASPLWLVPILVIGLALLLLSPLLAKLRGSAIAQPDSAPQGVPGTREASYEPVQEPRERRP